METNRCESGQKRTRCDHDDDQGQPIKRQKLRSDANTEFDTQITDVNNDCLQMIFEHLLLNDLFNVAVANGNLSAAAGLAFKRNFGNQTFKFSHRSIFMLKDDPQLPSSSTEIQTTAETDHMAFLHNFGVFLKRLNVNIDNGSYKSIENLILKNCADSLTEMSLGEADHRLNPSELQEVFRNIKQPFANVEKLCLNRCHMSEEGSRLNIWFPELRHLSLFDVKFTDVDVVLAHYPLLKHFGIGRWTNGCEHTLTMSQILTFLTKNPQIRSLDITLPANGYEHDFYRKINEILPELEQLRLCWDANSFKHHGNNVVAFKRLKKLALDFTFNSFTGARVLPFVFDQLTELEINNIPVLTEEWMEFIIRNKSLTKLTVLPFNEADVYFDRPNNQDLLRFAQKLSALNALTIDVTGITTNCILQFMMQCESVEVGQLFWNHLCGFNSFHHDFSKRGTTVFERIQGDWHVSPRNTNSIVLKRIIR